MIGSFEGFCGRCGLSRPEVLETDRPLVPCPKCGYTYGHVEARFDDFNLGVSNSLGYEARDPTLGRKKGKRIWGEVNTPEVYRATYTDTRVTRHFDKTADRYIELITDAKSGEIREAKFEPLTLHRNASPCVPARVVKLCPCVVRWSPAGDPSLLVFDHPLAGTQIPKGGHQPPETFEAGALRELVEETGLADGRRVAYLGAFERYVGAGPLEDGPIERHEWHLIQVESGDLRDEWTHVASGSPEENGLAFRCWWMPLTDAAVAELHTVFAEAARRVMQGAVRSP